HTSYRSCDIVIAKATDVQRRPSSDVFPGRMLFGFDEFGTVFVVNQFPAAALDTRQRRARPMIIQPLSPEMPPIIGSHLVQRVHDIVEIVRLDLRRTALTAMEEMAEIIH